ncbi:MAG: hypothetical protein B7Z61_08170 [Acidobacteria bacterium 37-71-11]|nr:MAG: hypothetical protein B7Z61_08170 [Acidobacteria bacterium 37-71-11]HQT95108.1 DUF433 domain-containing protein [Thermoanaerobaculaceae bacterium]
MARGAQVDPRDVANYGLLEAAHYLRLPVATLRSWVRGRPYPTAQGDRWFRPLVAPASDRPLLLSFTNLVEAHVLSAIRREHEIRLDRVRSALEYVRRSLGVKRPLANQVFHTDGIDLFVRKVGELVNVSRSGQLALRDVVEAYLRRVEWDEAGLAARLYPTARLTPDAPRLVVIDPRRGFGLPILMNAGVSTAVLAERFKAGESMDELAADYGCSSLDVSEAIRFELPQAA